MRFLFDRAAPLALAQTESVETVLGRMALRRVSSPDCDNRSLVFLHGYGEDMFFWERQAGILPGTSNVFDLPGHGESDLQLDVSRVTIDSLTQALEQACRALNLQKIWLIGHSYGGMLCAYLASRIADLLCGVIVIDQPLHAPSLEEIQLRQACRDADWEDLLDRDRLQTFMRGKFSLSEAEKILAACYRVPLALRRRLSFIKDHRLVDGLIPVPQINQPLLSVVSGLNKSWFRENYLNYLQQISTCAQLVEIPDVSHYLMLDAAAILNQLCRQFLGSKNG